MSSSVTLWKHTHIYMMLYNRPQNASAEKLEPFRVDSLGELRMAMSKKVKERRYGRCHSRTLVNFGTL
jgi:hypothetical protein